MDGVLAPHSLHLPYNVRCDHMTYTAGGVDSRIGIVRKTATYDVAEGCMHRVSVDGPGIIQAINRARVTVAPC